MKKKSLKTAALIMTAILTVSTPAMVFAEQPPEIPSGGGPGEGGQPPEGGGGFPGGSTDSTSIAWSGAKEITSATTEKGKTYSSSSEDQNALLIDTSDTVNIESPTVTKTGGSSASDQYSFYGTNSAVMAKGGGTTTIKGGTITTDAAGANGVFSYGANSGQTNATGDGTTVNITDTKITTTGSGSGGIMTTYGGTTNAKNLTVETSGGSSAPIRTDRGGGWVNVSGGTYTANGTGSPAIYSTADVKVSDATLVSNASEGVCIEGAGSVELTDCDLTDTNNKLNGNATFYDNIMIYQSQSGDASDGTSSFTMKGGSLKTNKGHTFHVTNTTSEINLEDVDITNSSDDVLISVCDDGWSGASNSATLNATKQSLSGTVLVGSDSTLNMNLKGSSTFKGDTSGVITNAKGDSVSTSLGTLKVNIESGSTWVLTSDCEVTSLEGSGSINYNGHTLTVNGTEYSSGNIGNITETNSSGSSDSEEKTTKEDEEENTNTEETSSKKDISSLSVTLSKTSYVYSGKQNKPEVTISGLTEGIDYTVNYSNNINVSKKALVTITGKGNYTGTIKKYFTITKAANTLKAKGKTVSLKYSSIWLNDKTISKGNAFTVSGAKGKVTFTKLKGNSKIKVSSAGKITVKRGLSKGTYSVKVKVKAAGNSNYKSSSKTIIIKVKVK